MVPRSFRTRALAAILTLGMIAGLATVLVPRAHQSNAEVASRNTRERGFDPDTAGPPWDQRCRLTVIAYEDGSASLHCGRRSQAFARVDAESGRIRMRMPWKTGR